MTIMFISVNAGVGIGHRRANRNDRAICHYRDVDQRKIYSTTLASGMIKENILPSPISDSIDNVAS